jgi:Family of unknown function (DUF6502)
MRAPSPKAEPSRALQRAVAQLLEPLARLAVARGLKFPEVKELLKQAFVQAAVAAEAAPGRASNVSRVATTTGLTRREVTRLAAQQPPARSTRSSPATQLFTRWAADRKLHDRQGRPRALPRQGPAPSFEALATAITRDVHPRRLLDELLRLGLAAHDADTDSVRLLEQAFVPRDDQARMLGFLGDNVADHFAAAVANVLGDEKRHFEQALFADELSDDSIETAKKLINAQWRALTAVLVPEIEDLQQGDKRAGRLARRRLRLGLYSYDETMQNIDDGGAMK